MIRFHSYSHQDIINTKLTFVTVNLTFQNAYGIGGTSEGAAMAHGEYQLDEDGTVEAEGSVQVKGYLSTEYSVRTQYEVTLYEWDVFVDGRADLMAWDMYLNLGERETQSAYHEYFLAVQVAEGEQFTLDNLNFIGNFDTGWYDPFRHELGISLRGMTIGQPYWEPTEEEEEQPSEPSSEEQEPETEIEEVDTGVEDFEENIQEEYSELELDSEPVKSGCNTFVTPVNNRWWLLAFPLMVLTRRRQNTI